MDKLLIFLSSIASNEKSQHSNTGKLAPDPDSLSNRLCCLVNKNMYTYIKILIETYFNVSKQSIALTVITYSNHRLA